MQLVIVDDRPLIVRVIDEALLLIDWMDECAVSGELMNIAAEKDEA